MIEVRDLCKYYGSTHAVDGVSFDVPPGQVLGFLGPNGAGKTTTMRVITCYLQPTQGTVLVDGLDVTTDALEVRKRIGYLPESAPLYNEMNVYDHLEYITEVRHIAPRQRRDAVRRAVESCGLQGVLSKNVGQLSSGYRQRVGLAQAIIHDPEILILDEPTRGLDPNQISEIRGLIRELGREKTVIFSTHILQEVQAVCDRVMIIHKGKMVFDGSKEDMSYGLSGKERVYLELQGQVDASSTLEGIEPVEAVRILSKEDGLTRLHVEAAKGSDVRQQIFTSAVEHGWTLLEMRRDNTSLEDVFREFTTT
jgi:ABC-2 type transport system ATP-binding protein